MTDLIVTGLTAEEFAEGKSRKPLRVSGPDGPPWPNAPSGPTSKGYYFNQQALGPAERWLIVHVLKRYPDVTVQNTAEAGQLAIVEYLGIDEIAIRFSEPTQGFADLT